MSRAHSRATLVDSFASTITEDTVQQRKGTPVLLKASAKLESIPTTPSSPFHATPTRAVKSNEATAFLKEEWEKQRLKIIELEKELAKQQDKFNKIEIRCKSDIERQAQLYEKQIAEKDEQIWKLEEKMKTVDRLRLDKRFLEEIVEAKNRELSTIRLHYQKQINDLYIKINEEQMKAKEEIEKSKLEMEKEIEKRAVARLNSKQKELGVMNHQLSKQSQRFEDELIRVGATKDMFEQENRTIKIEKQLIEESVKEYAKQALKLTNTIRDSNNKIRALENTLTQVIDSHETEVRGLKEMYMAEVKNREDMEQDLEAKIQHRTKELVNLKNVCKRILNQRSELEKFFMEALAHVKNEKMKFVTAAVYGNSPIINATREQQQLPPIRPVASAYAYESVKDGEGEDSIQTSEFDRLSWEEKEKVIKLLFSKMQNGPPQPAPSHHQESKSSPKRHASKSPTYTIQYDNTFLTNAEL